MRDADVVAAEQLSDETFYELDLRLARPGGPPVERRTREHSALWVRRNRRFVAHDPGGCWVADDGESLVGFATSVRRGDLWILATYVVRPDLQGQGIGVRILEAAQRHAAGCSRGMLSASADPKAVRRYLSAGFVLHPQMYLRGTVDRATIPASAGVREGAADDTRLLDLLDRHTRGAGHGPDHEHLQEEWRLLVADGAPGDRGYAYVDEKARVQLLAAESDAAARRVLWAALAETTGETTIAHVSAANAWAIDVGVRARLDVGQEGYLALRGMEPPTHYLHHGALL